MAQGMMAIDWARRSSGRMASTRVAVRGSLRSRGWLASLVGPGARGRGPGLASLAGGVFGRNSGLVRKRKGAVILQERLLCSSVTNRRRPAASYALALALELRNFS